MDAAQTFLFIVGFVTSAAVGYVTIRFLLNYLTNHSLRAFAFYRFGVAGVVAVLLLLGVGGF
jgi:undecaprenyl-diphosphatase